MEIDLNQTAPPQAMCYPIAYLQRVQGSGMDGRSTDIGTPGSDTRGTFFYIIWKLFSSDMLECHM